MSKKRRRHRLLDWLMGLVIVYSFVLWFFSSGLGRMPSHVELPLGGLGSIAVDSEGKLYVPAYWYNRLQIYDADGRFVRGLHVPMKAFAHYVDSQGNLHVWDYYGQYRMYAPTGELIIEEADTKPSIAADRGKAGAKEVTDGSGNVYSISRHAWLWPRVLKTSPNGDTRVLVSQPLYLWLIKCPHPVWVFGAVGLLYFVCVKPAMRPLGR